MTKKLFRDAAYLQIFTAQVAEIRGSAVRLVETAFYPGGGGQSCDTGRLNGIELLRTSLEANEIWHHLDFAGDLSALWEVQSKVSGELNWSRRFDLMQQHTGEHILGQAFFRLSCDVIAVNMEHSVCTLDLHQETTWELALEAENIANQAVLNAMPIRCYEIPEADISTIAFRRVPQVKGLIRVVQIGDFDYSACGGTHVATSSEVGLIKILKLERIKGGATRVYFNCGTRLLEDYRFKHDFISQLGLHFSSSLEAVPTRTLAVINELGAVKLELSQLRTQLAAQIAAGFLRGVIVHLLDDPILLPDLAKVCLQRENLIAILGATDGTRAFITVTCGAKTQQKASALLAVGLPHIQGKGGGKPDLAQGSGLQTGGLEAALEAMREEAKGY